MAAIGYILLLLLSVRKWLIHFFQIYLYKKKKSFARATPGGTTSNK